MKKGNKEREEREWEGMPGFPERVEAFEKEQSGCYSVIVSCRNCGLSRKVFIKKGCYVCDSECPKCGTKSLVKNI